MAVIIGSARIDEHGKASGGKAGDQTGKEVSTQSWYKHSKGWRTFRAKDSEKADLIAEAMELACKSPHIGYDQSQNTTLYNELDKVGFDFSKLKKNVETDCARLVRVCCRYAGIKTKDFYTASEASALLASGEFVELTDSKYNTKSDYLRRGDIQVTRTKGHTVVVLTNGPRAEQTPPPDPALGDRVLQNGDEGSDVKELQTKLIELGYDCGSYGADGEFGDDTEMAVRLFQQQHPPLEVDGEAGPETIKKLLSLLDADDTNRNYVKITGGNCFMREGPGKSYRDIGVIQNGSIATYLGEQSYDGWLKILYNDKTGWVSGKYGKLA